ncbi:MAG: PAS domain S-box protein [Actinobacteria bacterium]|nr:PAS domain S-box protein [Actinomycetota bacterium]
MEGIVQGERGGVPEPTIRDLSDVRTGEDAARESDGFHRFVERSPDLYYRYRFRPSPGFEYVSPSIAAIIGYTPEEAYADPDLPFKVVHPDDLHLWEEVNADPGGSGPGSSMRWLHRDGSVRWVELRNVPLLDGTGGAVGLEGIVRDVTERVAAQEALHASEERYRIVSELVSDYAYCLRMDPEGGLTMEWATSAPEVFTGYTWEELEERGGWRGMTHPDDLQVTEESWRRIVAGESAPFDQRIVTKWGEIRQLHVSGRSERDETGGVLIFGVAKDVTEQRLAEERTRSAAARAQILADISRTVAEAGLEPARVSAAIAQGSAELFGDTCVIWMMSQDERSLLPLGHHDPDPKAAALAGEHLATPRGVGEGIVGHAVMSGEPLLMPVTSSEELRGEIKPETVPFVDKVPVHSVLIAPVKAEGRVRGAFMFARHRPGDPYTEDDLTFAEELAAYAGQVIANASLYDSLRRADAERRGLLARLVTVQEEERRLVADDIHDDTIQVITAVVMRLAALRNRIEDPGQREALSALETTVQDAITRLRRLMFELRPPRLDRDGIVPTIREYVGQVADDAGFVLDIDDRMESEPAPEARSIVYRIAIEAVNNVRKHASARGVRMEFESRDGGVLARISDDGEGFDPEQVPTDLPGHLGITSMRERAELAGGWFRLESRPGAGTTVEVWVPGLGSPPISAAR